MPTKEEFFQNQPDRSNAGAYLGAAHTWLHDGNVDGAKGMVELYAEMSAGGPSQKALDYIQNILPSHGVSPDWQKVGEPDHTYKKT